MRIPVLPVDTVALVQWQTVAFILQALAAILALVAAVWIGRRQLALARRMTQEQNAESAAQFARQQQEANERAEIQHQRTLELLQLEWQKADERRQFDRTAEQQCILDMMGKFVSDLAALRVSAAGPHVVKDGRVTPADGVRHLHPAFAALKGSAAEAKENLKLLDPVLSRTMRGTVARSRLRTVLETASLPSREVNQQVEQYQQHFENWVEKLATDFENAVKTV